MSAPTPAESGAGSFFARVLAPSPDDVDVTEEITARLLEAARDVFSRVGVQRATMEDVAKAAGYARVTVYRRFANKDALVEQVVRWEFRSYFTQFLDDIKGARDAEERVVLGFVSSLRSMRGNSLIRGLLSAEPAYVVPSVVGEHGRTLATVRDFLAGQLRREQQAGTIAAHVNVELVAELMVRVTTSFLVTPSEIVDLDDDEQLAAVAREFLVPMLGVSGGGRGRGKEKQ